MKKIGLILLVFIFASCDSANKISFEQVGYFKSSDNIRYFTFYVNTPEAINKNSISEELFNSIKGHGSSLMNTSGKITGSFYYLSKDQTPDITLFSDAPSAENFAIEKEPIAVVWIFPTGLKKLVKQPK